MNILDWIDASKRHARRVALLRARLNHLVQHDPENGLIDVMGAALERTRLRASFARRAMGVEVGSVL